MLNPMVNKGITLDAATHRIDFANGLHIDDDSDAAGLQKSASDAYLQAPIPCQPYQVYDAWDTDAEGFANPRVSSRAFFASGPLGDVDLGADEMGDLVMAGYLDNTRVFARMDERPWWCPNLSPPINQTQIYFLDIPYGGPYSRPVFNATFGGFLPNAIMDWYVNVQTNPVPPPPNSSNYVGNYGSGKVDMYLMNMPTWRSQMLTQGQKVMGLNTSYIMRNLACDFSPLLTPDPKPLWATFADVVPGTYPTSCSQFPVWYPGFDGRDHYAANPWIGDDQTYSHQRQPGGLLDPPPSACDLTLITDNPFAYYNPSPGYPASAGQTPTWISVPTSGIMNPPGTYLDMNFTVPPTSAPRLNVGASPLLGVFGPFAPCVASSATTYDVSLSGVGDSANGCPDEIPDFLWAQGVGIRINCMRGVGATGIGSGNLQTFLVYSRTTINDLPLARETAEAMAAGRIPGGASTGAEGRVVPSTREQLHSGLRELMESSRSR